MVAGDPMKRSYGNDKESAAINYACLNYNGPATPETNGFPNRKCSSGLRAQVFFPSCWDGKNLDSPDHRSHMSYPVNSHAYGSCPPSHPVHFVSLFYETIFSTDKFEDMWYGDKQPFVWSMGDPTGYGLHGDFFNGWDTNVLQQAIDQCTSNSGRVEDCPVFTLTPDNVATGCRIPPSINEQTSGTLPALPGCNPVQPGPDRAVPKSSGCTVSNTISEPKADFTDLTQSKQWSYAGCGYDSIYSRKFTGASTSSNTMTIETCVDFCSGKGFSVAGAEYGRECYCANSIPAEAAPVPGYAGDCTMPCSGDSTQNCGGPGTISLYKKCSSTCQNVENGLIASAPTSPLLNVGGSSSVSSTRALSSTSAQSSVASTVRTSVVSSSRTSAVSSAATSSPATSASSGAYRPSSTAVSNTPVSSSTRAAATSVPTSASSTRVSSTTSSSKPSRTTTSSIPTSSPRTNVNLPTGWRAAGCYVDPVFPRLFPIWASFSGASVTSTKCVAWCAEQGYPVAGTENGGQCFCAKTIPADAELKPDGECNTPCKGAAAEMCGGPARLSAFTNLTRSAGGTYKRHLHKHRRSHDVVLLS